MSPTTPRRVGDKPNSASPSTISTPRLKVQPQRSYSDHWWIEQQRQQPQISGGFYTLLAPETSLHATEPMEFKAQNCHNSPSSSPTGVPRRGQSVVSATSSDRNRYSDHAFTIDKIGNTTAPGPNSPIFQDNHASASEHGSDQENQSPANFPSTPPNEHTSRRLQRDPLQQLALDGHGQPIHTTASRPANLFSHPGFALATSSDVDEDAYLDTDSNTPTIVLSATRKRGAGHLEEEDDDDNDGNDGPRDESPRAAMLKRLKTSHGSTEVDSLAGTKVRKTQQEQESNHITSASKRSMGSRHHLVPATGQFRPIKACSTKPQRNSLSSTGAIYLDHSADKDASKLAPHQVLSPNSGLIAPPSSPIGLDGSTSIDSSPGTIKGTKMRPQESFHIQPQIPTPAKTLTFLSSQQVLALPEPKPTHAILGRLDETEEACTRWLAEVRNKKIHYRRMLAQQELDRKDIEDDMARLEQLEPIIQVMAAEELHKVDVAIRVQEEEANELREQQKELRQRVLNFEHLKQAFEEERQLGL